MKKLIGLVLVGLMAFTSAVSALPIFSHTDDGAGNYIFTADNRTQTNFMSGVLFNGITGSSAIGSDYGFTQPGNSYAISDSDNDNFIQFLFSDPGYLVSTISGTVAYWGEESETFVYTLIDSNDQGPTSSVPEPSTLLLMSVGMIGLGATRLRKKI